MVDPAHPTPQPTSGCTALVYPLLVAASCVASSKQQPLGGAPHPSSVWYTLEKNEIVGVPYLLVSGVYVNEICKTHILVQLPSSGISTLMGLCWSGTH